MAPGLGSAFLAFLVMLAPQVIGPVLLHDWGVLMGTDAARVEWSTGLLVVSAAGLALMMRLQPLGIGWGRRSTMASLVTYLAAAVLWWVLVVGYLRGMAAVGAPVAVQPQLQYFAAVGPGRLPAYLVIAVVVLVGPWVEEVVFRGYLHGALRLHLGRNRAILAGAVVFGLVHGLDKALPTALLGLLLAWMRERWGSMWPCFLAHALHNAIVVSLVIAWPQLLEYLYPR